MAWRLSWDVNPGCKVLKRAHWTGLDGDAEHRPALRAHLQRHLCILRALRLDKTAAQVGVLHLYLKGGQTSACQEGSLAAGLKHVVGSPRWRWWVGCPSSCRRRGIKGAHQSNLRCEHGDNAWDGRGSAGPPSKATATIWRPTLATSRIVALPTMACTAIVNSFSARWAPTSPERDASIARRQRGSRAQFLRTCVERLCISCCISVQKSSSVVLSPAAGLQVVPQMLAVSHSPWAPSTGARKQQRGFSVVIVSRS